MKINFYPDSDAEELVKAVSEYEQVWSEEGGKIVREIEKLSGLKFTRKFLNAIVWLEPYAWSYPLAFSYSSPLENKKMDITHELCHRLMSQNKIEAKPFTRINTHKQIFLILYDVLLNLYGEEEAKIQINAEIELWIKTGGKEEDNPYEEAWDYAIKMTKEERQKEFRKYLR